MAEPAAATAVYVQRPFSRLAEWPDPEMAAGWPAHIAAQLRALAVDSGQALTGEPEFVKREDGPPVDTDDGPKKTYVETWRAPAKQADDFVTATVEARETTPGVWTADVPPGAAIVSVKHGLNTYKIDVDAIDADGQPTGYYGPFVPVSPGEVEVVPGAKVHQFIVTKLPDEDAEGGEHRPDVQSPRQVDA